MQLNALLKPFPRVLFTILPALSNPCEVMHLLFHAHARLKKLKNKKSFSVRELKYLPLNQTTVKIPPCF